MKNIFLLILTGILSANISWCQEEKQDKIVPYISFSGGYFQMNSYETSCQYTIEKNGFWKISEGLSNHRFKAGLTMINFHVDNDHLLMYGIENSGNLLNSKKIYFGPAMQFGFVESGDSSFIKLYGNLLFHINWHTFISLGTKFNYGPFEICIYKQYAEKHSKRRTWMIGISIDFFKIYELIQS